LYKKTKSLSKSFGAGQYMSDGRPVGDEKKKRDQFFLCIFSSLSTSAAKGEEKKLQVVFAFFFVARCEKKHRVVVVQSGRVGYGEMEKKEEEKGRGSCKQPSECNKHSVRQWKEPELPLKYSPCDKNGEPLLPPSRKTLELPKICPGDAVRFTDEAICALTFLFPHFTERRIHLVKFLCNDEPGTPTHAVLQRTANCPLVLHFALHCIEPCVERGPALVSKKQ
jgi:hypothetical protein